MGTTYILSIGNTEFTMGSLTLLTINLFLILAQFVVFTINLKLVPQGKKHFQAIIYYHLQRNNQDRSPSINGLISTFDYKVPWKSDWFVLKRMIGTGMYR